VRRCPAAARRAIPLRWEEGRYARLVRDDDGIAIQLPGAAKPSTAARLLRDFYIAEAQADVGRWLPRYLPALPRPPSRLRLRPLRSLWGSLSPDDAVSLDLALVLAPPAAFEYVLVHELCHLLQRNHGPRFWREVEARAPDWRVQRTYLRGEGMGLKSQLRVLLGGG
jgi:predicted metal-dependent hydrolase